MGSIERALMPLNQMPPDVDVPLPPHVDWRAEILRALDQFSSTRSQTLTMDLALGRVLQQTLAALTSSYLTQPMMRELYGNIAAMSQIASASRMTTTALPYGPPRPEDVASTTAPSISTVGPSVSQVGPDFETPHTPLMTSAIPLSMTPVTSPVTPETGQAETTSTPARPATSERFVTGMGVDGWMEVSTLHDNLTMEFTDPLELDENSMLQEDRYYGAYPDFKIPVMGHPRISEVFYANTVLISNDNFPMMLIHLPEWEPENHTAVFAVDRGNGRLYAIYQQGAKLISRRGWIDADEETAREGEPVEEERVPGPATSGMGVPYSAPLAASTPAVESIGRGRSTNLATDDTRRMSPISEEFGVSTNAMARARQAAVEMSSTSSVHEEEMEGMTPEMKQQLVLKSNDIGCRLEILFENWRIERANAPREYMIKDIDEFHQPYIRKYMDRKNRINHWISKYEEAENEAMMVDVIGPLPQYPPSTRTLPSRAETQSDETYLSPSTHSKQ